MRRITLILFGCSLLACGSPSEPLFSSNGATASSGTGSDGGGDGTGGGGGSDASDGGSGTGGSACVPSKTCATIGAECGTIADDGCGNPLDCGKCAAPFTCGGKGEAYKCGCVPKTCEDYGANCGTVHDDCSGKDLDCGTCSGDPRYVTCGGDSAPDLQGNITPGTPNVCNGGCTYVGNAPHAPYCKTMNPDKPYLVKCSNSDEAPSDLCNYYGENGWCCPAGWEN